MRHEFGIELATDHRSRPLHPDGIRSRDVLCWRLATIVRMWIRETHQGSLSPPPRAEASSSEPSASPRSSPSLCSAPLPAPLLPDSAPNTPDGVIPIIIHPSQDEDAEQQLMRASCDGDVDTVARLLMAGVNPNHHESKWCYADGGSMLAAACQAGHAECAKLLVQARANTSTANYLGLTPYDIALWGGDSMLADEVLGDLEGGAGSSGERWLALADALLTEWAALGDETIVSSSRSAVCEMVAELEQAAMAALEAAQARGLQTPPLAQCKAAAGLLRERLGAVTECEDLGACRKSAAVPTLGELLAAANERDPGEWSQALADLLVKWRQGASIRVSMLPQPVLQELVDLGCIVNEESGQCDIWELHRPLSSSCFLASSQANLTWISKDEYLTLLKAPSIPVLDHLLSFGMNKSSDGSKTLSKHSAELINQATSLHNKPTSTFGLSVGMIHAVVARTNLVHGLGSLQMAFREAGDSNPGGNPTVAHALRVSETVNKKAAVWISFLDMIASEQRVADSECVRSVEIEVLRLIERANAALMALTLE
eukprot:TRINITY_DN27720_c0_g1_i2.p1 TRINITY_DN27720_c0_g1~~TRINITY_DN27720_c0_g1_i2.p1  ORF type:complete len:544 (+),score=101.92 TRINITY_DN27720_c0_g1_i2:308-1939(+)